MRQPREPARRESHRGFQESCNAKVACLGTCKVAEGKEIDVDDLVLVDANPRIGAFNIDLTEISASAKGLQAE
jgi:hypothetical protein